MLHTAIGRAFDPVRFQYRSALTFRTTCGTDKPTDRQIQVITLARNKAKSELPNPDRQTDTGDNPGKEQG